MDAVFSKVSCVAGPQVIVNTTMFPFGVHARTVTIEVKNKNRKIPCTKQEVATLLTPIVNTVMFPFRGTCKNCNY